MGIGNKVSNNRSVGTPAAPQFQRPSPVPSAPNWGPPVRRPRGGSSLNLGSVMVGPLTRSNWRSVTVFWSEAGKNNCYQISLRQIKVPSPTMRFRDPAVAVPRRLAHCAKQRRGTTLSLSQGTSRGPRDPKATVPDLGIPHLGLFPGCPSAAWLKATPDT